MVELSQDIPLGRAVSYVDHYCPQLLFPISRQASRDGLGIDSAALPFTGVDIWNAYELSWLNPKGKPVVACGEFRFPCESRAIIESKSFKLYLNSFNQERFDSVQQLRERMVADLSTAVAAAVEVSIGEVDNASTFSYLPGKCLDQLDVSVLSYQPDAALLQITGTKVVEETLFSHLLRSLCPVTAQPDWASVVIEYRGLPINHEGLLKYLIGYRQHQEFHEQCVERIYTDLMACCKPESLSVYARYVRRGGLDINPYRSSHGIRPVNWRLPRQ